MGHLVNITPNIDEFHTHSMERERVEEQVSEVRTSSTPSEKSPPRNGCAPYEPRRAGTFTHQSCAHCSMTCCAYTDIRDMLCPHWHSCSPLFRVFPHRNIAFSLDSGLAQHSIPKRRAKVDPKLHSDLFQFFCTKEVRNHQGLRGKISRMSLRSFGKISSQATPLSTLS